MNNNIPVCCNREMEGRPPIKSYRGWIKIYQCSVCKDVKQERAEPGERLNHYKVVRIPGTNKYAVTLRICRSMVDASEYAEAEREKTDAHILTAEVDNKSRKWGVYKAI